MEDKLENLLADRNNRFKLIEMIQKDPNHFQNAVKIAVTNRQPDAWHAAWILDHCIEKNDPRLRDHINALIQALKTNIDGYQRQLLKILERMQLEEDQEGPLFNICMTIWESVGKNPSVRITAFTILVKIAQNYPELKHEITFLTDDRYTETLSPGIKHSFKKLCKRIKKI